MKVSTLKKKVSRIYVTVPGEGEDPAEVVWVDYRPGELTLEVSDELKAAVASGFESDVAYVMMSRVLSDWDLQDDEGRPLGVTEQAIKSVPLTFIGLIMEAIQEDARPNPRRDANSEDTSQQTGKSDASLTGTSSSEQPTGSLVGPGSS